MTQAKKVSKPQAQVYFTDFHMPYGGDPLPVKLAKLMKKAGFDKIDFKNKFGKMSFRAKSKNLKNVFF